MSVTIRFLEAPPLRAPNPESRHYDGTVDWDKLAVGDMCFYHHRGVPCTDPEQLKHMNLTAHYFSKNAGRAPLILKLPDRSSKSGLYFMVDGQCYSGQCLKCGKARTKCKCGDAYKPKGYYDGWTVTGSPPKITVSPSVNYDDEEAGRKHYHGFIKEGVIGDG